MDITDLIILFVLGSLGGFISGFLGVGGGIVYVPILSFFLSRLGLEGDELVKGILANSLFTIIFSGTISSFKQYRKGNFFPRQILQTALPGIVSVLVMTYLIRNGDWYSLRIFNYVFAAMLLTIALRMLLSGHVHHESGAEATPLQYGITGFFTGMITALSGLGGGVVMTPVITDLFKQPIRKASSISNGVIPLFAIAVGLYNLGGHPPQVNDYQVGYIVFPLVLPMILSAFITAPLGVTVSHRVSPKQVRITFALFVSAVFLKTIWQIFF